MLASPPHLPAPTAHASPPALGPHVPPDIRTPPISQLDLCLQLSPPLPSFTAPSSVASGSENKVSTLDCTLRSGCSSTLLSAHGRFHLIQSVTWRHEPVTLNLNELFTHRSRTRRRSETCGHLCFKGINTFPRSLFFLSCLSSPLFFLQKPKAALGAVGLGEVRRGMRVCLLAAEAQVKAVTHLGPPGLIPQLFGEVALDGRVVTRLWPFLPVVCPVSRSQAFG